MYHIKAHCSQSYWTRCIYFILVAVCIALLPEKLLADDLIKVKSTVEFIDLHTSPGRGYPVFHVIEKGEIITLIKSKNNWVKAITEKGITGWIHRRNMQNTIGINGEEVQLGIPSIDDYSNRRWEVGFGLGQFENIPSLGIHGGFRFTNNITAEIQFTQATGNQSKNEIITLGLVHQPFPEWRFSPYFSLATGNIKTTARSRSIAVEDANDEVFLLSAGGYYYMSNRFMIKVEFNQYTSLPSEDFNNEINEFKLGFSSFF